ncbi:CAZyme family AA3 [Penicillium roqueforti]|uniref:CAZyme family AA3 n=1 Tax=Penicillium roqueforti TaxID=5082 RepID=UPI00190A864A|nr:CAZyme family AA3 [Penicillium roqueforti]KAF9241500.1 CAZyme family AA3 [Penicillium roqueforti]KAI1830318.1 CAZyme family AA3 [Penicillium roqueforti]KAI2696354.1 CAZyme family AA3 [Penicillium roqueforti]KAI3102399.1 CAZyme family AA3 [Penicillium roqueforti]KAI3146405.1 CAZyme family AA3 [Penicillium roqueforti]
MLEGKNLINWSSTSTVLGNLLDYNPTRRLDLRDEHICEKLETEVVNGVPRVTSAIVKNLTKPRTPEDPEDKIRIKAKYVVVCAGPILTPQLLYKSGFIPEDKDEHRPDLSNEHMYLPALGRNLTEQTMCFCQIVLKDDWVKELQGSKWDEQCAEHRKKFDKDADPLQIPFDDLDPQITLPVGPEHEWHTQIHRDAFSYGAVPPAIDTRTIVDLRFFGQAKPNWDNRVKFSQKLTGAYGMPQPTFVYKPDEQDRMDSHRMMKDMEEVAGVLGGYLPGSEPQFLSPGLALHVCGTTKSQKRDPKKEDSQQKEFSCCDEHSKIWGIENLYVGGLNVISGPNASNPTLTAMCHAIKGAEAIRHKLKRKQKA